MSQGMIYASPTSCNECGGRNGHTPSCSQSSCGECGGRNGHTPNCAKVSVANVKATNVTVVSNSGPVVSYSSFRCHDPTCCCVSLWVLSPLCICIFCPLICCYHDQQYANLCHERDKERVNVSVQEMQGNVDER